MRANTPTLNGSVSLALATVLSAAAVFPVSGCSPATRYYTLSQSGEAPTIQVPPVASVGLVGVGPVELPDYVDRPQIVVRTSANTVDQATFDQWGGNLDGMLHRVLVDDLALRLPAAHFVQFPQSGDLPFDLRVPVTISQFDISQSGEAVLAARWQVRGKSVPDGVVVGQTLARTQAEGESFQQKVAALSAALGILADEISAALAKLPRAADSEAP